MKKLGKSFLIKLFILTGVVLCSIGPSLSQINDYTLTQATYENNTYIQEDSSKINCDLNGAWTTEYKYYWLADPNDAKQNLPPFVRNISYKDRAFIQESNIAGISTPETGSKNDTRNKYFLSSPLPDETLAITLDLENTNGYINWYPISLYFDPFVIGNPKQELKIKLSYADGSLGNIVYIENTNLNVGCYLKLFVKSPPAYEAGKLTIELKPEEGFKAGISSIFWGEEKEAANLEVTFDKSIQVSATDWLDKNKNAFKALLWAPIPEDKSDTNSIVSISLGKIIYRTHNGFEFPFQGITKDYNFNILQGFPGPKGKNGLEFYVSAKKDLCSEGCELGLYGAENYEQNIFIYSAYEDKENKLLATVKTVGDDLPAFYNFHISPTNEASLRIRITTDNSDVAPTLSGLYVLPLSYKSVDSVDEENSQPIESTPAPTPLPSPIVEDPGIQKIVVGNPITKVTVIQGLEEIGVNPITDEKKVHLPSNEKITRSNNEDNEDNDNVTVLDTSMVMNGDIINVQPGLPPINQLTKPSSFIHRPKIEDNDEEEHNDSQDIFLNLDKTPISIIQVPIQSIIQINNQEIKDTIKNTIQAIKDASKNSSETNKDAMKNANEAVKEDNDRTHNGVPNNSRHGDDNEKNKEEVKDKEVKNEATVNISTTSKHYK